jgi:hypothetical protein
MIRDTILKVKTGEGEIKVYRTTIGGIEGPPENKYSVEQDVLKTMFFCKEKLKFPLRKKLEIFDTAVFTESQDGEFKPETNRFMDAGGISYKSKIYINTSADQEITSIVDTPEGGTLVSGAKLVNRRRQSDIASHEIVHFMDVSSYTRPQREGLATAVEWGFDFDISLRRLRHYNNAITPDRVKMLMSSKPPSNLTLTEVYSVSASFFCWLYKELGSENFATFYDRISGSAGRRYEKKSIQNQLLGPIDPAPELSWRGNLEKTLDSLPHDYHWTWETSDDLLANFVSDVEAR